MTARRGACALCDGPLHVTREVVMADVMLSSEMVHGQGDPSLAGIGAVLSYAPVAVHPWCKRDALAVYEASEGASQAGLGNDMVRSLVPLRVRA